MSVRIPTATFLLCRPISYRRVSRAHNDARHAVQARRRRRRIDLYCSVLIECDYLAIGRVVDRSVGCEGPHAAHCGTTQVAGVLGTEDDVGAPVASSVCGEDRGRDLERRCSRARRIGGPDGEHDLVRRVRVRTVHDVVLVCIYGRPVGIDVLGEAPAQRCATSGGAEDGSRDRRRRRPREGPTSRRRALRGRRRKSKTGAWGSSSTTDTECRARSQYAWARRQGKARRPTRRTCGHRQQRHGLLVYQLSSTRSSLPPWSWP